MRGISLDQIVATTKIGRRLLTALEEEQFDLLPGGIFNKAYVRAYAKCVGMNEDEAVAEYLAAAQEEPPDTKVIAHQHAFHGEQRGAFQLPGITSARSAGRCRRSGGRLDALPAASALAGTNGSNEYIRIEYHTACDQRSTVCTSSQ